MEVGCHHPTPHKVTWEAAGLQQLLPETNLQGLPTRFSEELRSLIPGSLSLAFPKESDAQSPHT